MSLLPPSSSAPTAPPFCSVQTIDAVRASAGSECESHLQFNCSSLPTPDPSNLTDPLCSCLLAMDDTLTPAGDCRICDDLTLTGAIDSCTTWPPPGLPPYPPPSPPSLPPPSPSPPPAPYDPPPAAPSSVSQEELIRALLYLLTSLSVLVVALAPPVCIVDVLRRRRLRQGASGAPPTPVATVPGPGRDGLMQGVVRSERAQGF